MTHAISLRAVRTLHHAGRVIAPGTSFEATPIEAAALRYQHAAVFADASASSDDDLSSPDSRPSRSERRRRYRRRDLQAEP